MNTNDLIERLAAEATPVRPLSNPARRAALWTGVALVSVTMGVLYIGVREDASEAWHRPGVVLRTALLAVTMWLAVVTAFRMSVPGHDLRAWSRWWPLAALGALVALAAAEVVRAALVGNAGSPLNTWRCVGKVVFVGAAPAVLAVALIQRAAALEPRWAFLLGVLAAGAAGALASELACPIQEPMHIMLWHVLPVAASAGLGALLGVLFWRPRANRRLGD